MKVADWLTRFLIWRSKNISDKQLILALSVVIGLAVGMAAVIIKRLVLLIESFIESFEFGHFKYLYIILPFIGISLTVLFVKYINRRPVRHGIPGVLYAISKNKGKMNAHNLYSSIISSALTVGFGGSVGLEGPTVATGAAIGSRIGLLLNLSYKQITLMLGCASAGAMASIFKAPIAAIVFALEVIMLDLTMSAIVPLLISSTTAALVSYFFQGQNYLYSFEITDRFELNQIGYFIIFAVFAGVIATYFNKVYTLITEAFEKINDVFLRLLIGGFFLGVVIFFIPSLYGEGYEVINASLRGDFTGLFQGTFFSGLEDRIFGLLLVLLLVLLFKVAATSLTFGSGGVGGVFAPSLYTGAITGLLYSRFLGLLGIEMSASSLALVGMAGMIAGVIHAPLTAIFLIAELTGGYDLFMPLMIVSTISYATSKIFVSNSVYTLQLAKRGELMTHHKDKAVLMQLQVHELIETDFNILHPNEKMAKLINTIKFAHRNIFPVVEEDGTFRGIVKLDDIRHIMFNSEMYDSVYVRDLMFMPQYVIFSTDSMEEVARKFQESGRYNIAVLEHGKYLGFISRAKLFSAYRKLLKDFSEE